MPNLRPERSCGGLGVHDVSPRSGLTRASVVGAGLVGTVLASITVSATSPRSGSMRVDAAGV